MVSSMGSKIISDIFTKVENEEKDIYLKFLNDEPLFEDLSMRIAKKNKKIEEEKLKKEQEQERLKQVKEEYLKQLYKKDEDYRYMIKIVWLETHIKDFENIYGPFSYSTSNLSYQEKYEELLEYFGDVCGISNVEDIRKPHRSFSH